MTRSPYLKQQHLSWVNYDAEGRITSATNNASQQSIYTYDADGRRVRRNSYGQETWQVYGLDGELLAEYATNGAPSSPQKEYGYRNGELLVTAAASAYVKWLVNDQLGTPRMVVDKSGSLIGIKRHDYLPFGEELFAGTGNRTTQQGYNASDGVRQKFTGYERDVETGLDYAEARYFSSNHGRFTSTDPLLASGRATLPQSWNRYAYVLNNPLRKVDPTGLSDEDSQKKEPVPQQEQKPVATVSATAESGGSGCHMCFGPVPTTVVIDQMNEPDLGVANVKGTDSLVVGVDLKFTFLDESGAPVTNATVVEDVEALDGPKVDQNKEPVPLNAKGQASDLVSENSGPVPKTQADERKALTHFNQDVVTRQRITLTVVTDTGRMVRVTQERTLTNRVPGAPSLAGGRIKGYTFTMEKPKIEIIR